MRHVARPILVLSACLSMILACWPAHANPVPVPVNCTVTPHDAFEHPRIVGLPATGGALQFAHMVVTVMDSSGTPIPNAHVQLLFDPSCTDLCICPSAILEGYTNPSGVVTLVTALGGCCQGPEAATLLVMGIPVRVYDTVASPDLTGATGAGDCSVSLRDFAAFGGCFGSTGGGPCACADLTGDERVGVGDLVVFGGVWGQSCR